MYPVMLNLKGRKVLVVGGGGVALRKVSSLVAEEARVTAVAPVLVRGLRELASEGAVTVEERAYRAGEAHNFALVFAATDDREVNRQVAADATREGVFVNVADDPELSSFHLPARVQRGALQISVASEGGAPFVVRRLKQLLERRFGAEWAEWIEAAVDLRRRVRALGLPRDQAEQRYDAFFAATVDGDRLQARVLTPVERHALLGPVLADKRRVADGGLQAAGLAAAGLQPPGASGETRTRGISPVSTNAPTSQATAALRAPDNVVGLVSLVGGGPGDASLLTLRGRQRLLAADAVVYDRLAASALPCDLPRGVELHCVGKEAGHHPVPQEEINELLIRLARAGKRTVRLKGGDPCIFGRAGEEAEALEAAGVPWEIVPGVTSGVAAASYAGIPVTHRGEAVRLTLVTAHESKKSDGPQVDWSLLARDPHATLVGYMGLSTLPQVAAKLILAGMSPSTPAAVISQGTTAAQRSVVTTLRELPSLIATAGLTPPALFIIGPTVRHAEVLSWATRRPLWGERLGLFAPTGDLGSQLELAGAELVEVPLAITPAARVVLAARPLTGFVLRSTEEIDAFEEVRDCPSWGTAVVAWCIGRAAAQRAQVLGLPNVHELRSDDALALLGAALERRLETQAAASSA
jgi:uroporphyrin-III C-methyltransferase/precorrin-2 dehydrogenase/sirohydrochlorin ferrochelatase